MEKGDIIHIRRLAANKRLKIIYVRTETMEINRPADRETKNPGLVFGNSVDYHIIR